MQLCHQPIEKAEDFGNIKKVNTKMNKTQVNPENIKIEFYPRKKVYLEPSSITYIPLKPNTKLNLGEQNIIIKGNPILQNRKLDKNKLINTSNKFQEVIQLFLDHCDSLILMEQD